MSTSLVYKNIHLYRLIMNLIYTGSYAKRFKTITAVLSQKKPSSVLELCFGDTYIAEYCKSHNIKWQGIDINEGFVNNALVKGFNAIQGDLLGTNFDKADMVLISGSLYHFAPGHVEELFEKVFKITSMFLISEPVKNLSSDGGLIGFIAKRSANAGKGNEHFRYTEETLMKDLNTFSVKFNYGIQKMGFMKKDMVVLLTKTSNA